MPDITISVNGVQKLLEQLKPAKAAGADGIPTHILKTCAADLAPVLAQLFQQTLNEETIPDDWRTANVTPIFKKKVTKVSQPITSPCLLHPSYAN